jgi:hypothetical protein
MRSWKAVAAIALVLAASSTLLSVLLYERQSRDSDRTTNALCTLREDLSQRVDSSKDFLSKHPKGIPGVPVQTILDSIANQQRTIDALSTLSCR